MSTALAVTLVLLLTPCCEIFAAAPAAGMPANTGVSQTQHDHCGAPTSGEHCASWLDQAFLPVGDAALPVAGWSGIDAPPLNWQASMPVPRMSGVVPHAGAPPPARALYRFTSRLLL